MVIDGLAGYYKRNSTHIFQPGVPYENFADDSERLVVTGKIDATLKVESRNESEGFNLEVNGISDDGTWVTLFSGTISSLPKTFTGYRIYNVFTPYNKSYMTFTVTY